MPLSLFPVLHTPRLTVRPVDVADLPDLMAVNGDDAVTRFLPYATWTCTEDAQSWLQRMRALEATGTGRQFVLASKANGRVVGTLLLFKADAGSARCEIGYVLGREHWGRGLMFEALQAACDTAFTSAGLRRLEAEVQPDNTASNAVLQRLGFVREGTLRQRWVGKGRAYDTHVWGLLASDARPQSDVTSAGSS
jgi:[ribosomal protein S5]-alanine N-acetyltransferase